MEYNKKYRKKSKYAPNGIDFDNADDDTQKKCKDIWYKERVFNLLREHDGFICNDRFNDGVDNYNIEEYDNNIKSKQIIDIILDYIQKENYNKSAQ